MTITNYIHYYPFVNHVNQLYKFICLLNQWSQRMKLIITHMFWKHPQHFLHQACSTITLALPLFHQEVIEAYLASCRRAPKSSPTGDDDDDADDPCDGEDAAAQKEFEDFKKWLDDATPSSSDGPSEPVVLSKPICKRCGSNNCDWYLALISFTTTQWSTLYLFNAFITSIFYITIWGYNRSTWSAPPCFPAYAKVQPLRRSWRLPGRCSTRRWLRWSVSSFPQLGVVWECLVPNICFDYGLMFTQIPHTKSIAVIITFGEPVAYVSDWVA